MFKCALAGNLEGALAVFDEIWKENYCIHDLINYFGRMLDSMEDMDRMEAHRFRNKIADLKMKDSEGLGTKV